MTPFSHREFVESYSISAEDKSCSGENLGQEATILTNKWARMNDEAKQS